ncbi:unnamed protein product [Vitrella brassicaformis CCMP3155]|uniref:XPA C-terminal domain-containing protein n=1 Tax=Vitrella brassicaformis (strain CCMP3155) TaxID=1169540 RepID=A0A0G4G957_VITBC|nr:unnamed protein product [Vitrella brassicaformis CCMP3155]|eukprot:CEM25363.1 unnamed protein product [Vitrella brassicaformis CCMP3155]
MKVTSLTPQLPKCQHCGLDQNLDKPLATVGVYVCFPCFMRRKESEYRRISQANACKKFGLTAADITSNQEGLAVLIKPNPHGYGNEMRLYFEFQMRELAVKKYGSVDAMEVALEAKKDKQIAALQRDAGAKRGRKASAEGAGEGGEGIGALLDSMGVSQEDKKRKAKAPKKGAKKARKADDKRSAAPPAPLHEHKYGPDLPVEGQENHFYKECVECGHRVEWDEI